MASCAPSPAAQLGEARGTADLATFEATTLTAFYTRMIARVRETAPDTLIFFDPPGPDAGVAITSMERPEGQGLVFAPHYYQLPALQGLSGNGVKAASDLRRWANQGKAWSVPVLVGEFGAANPTMDARGYLQAHFDALDALGLHGTQWEYSVAAELWNSEDLSLTRADGSETPMAEAIVRAYPRAVAGEDVSFTYDAATRGLTLSFTAASGVTEIVMPARLYLEGYDVSAANACADSSRPGVLLVRATSAGAKVEVTVTAR